ncbi:hypothetical protein WME73_36130 [Sorangium sp. So ce302]|uniref:hypothetical protein n=1 Tax=unclassified Sorangium TaxID=2621164 RepID=UPI003F642870
MEPGDPLEKALDGGHHPADARRDRAVHGEAEERRRRDAAEAGGQEEEEDEPPVALSVV